MSSDFAIFFNSIPPLTRWMTALAGGLSLGTMVGLISPYNFFNYWPLVYGKYQLWRPFTAFFVTSGQPINAMFDIYMLYTNSRRIEEKKFSNSADYAFYLSFIATIVIILNYFTEGMIYLRALAMALNYTWAQDNTEQPATFFFFKCKTKHLPLLTLASEFFMSASLEAAMVSITGLLAAHLFLYLDTIYPRTTGNRSPLRTPQFFYTAFRNLGSLGYRPSQTTTQSGRTVHSTSFGSYVNPREGTSGASSKRPEPQLRTPFQGSGHRLGKE